MLHYDVKLLSQQQKQGDVWGHNHIKTASPIILKNVFNVSNTQAATKVFQEGSGRF